MTATRSAFTAHTDSAAAARELVAGLDGAAPRVVVFFAGVKHDGAVLGEALAGRFPGACVLGCSSDGEFSDRGHGKGGAVALAISSEHVGDCAVALADCGGDLDAAIRDAAERLSARLGRPIRELDPTRWAGLALLEGAHGREERINAALGDVAPFLPFVGGSAGDDITFTGTWTWADGRLARDGTALLVAEMRGPFEAFKTCNFVATERSVLVTRCDPERRLILELDGQPAVPAYARAVGADPAELGLPVFLANPLGLMIDGEPWLRSVVRREGDALFFACSVVEGARLNIMRATDLVDDARAALARAEARLGGPIAGALLFNCAFRMIEAQIKGQEAAYHTMLSRMVHAGIHSNGESYLGHINQTLTGLVWR
jgi:hypothetical protein